VARGTASGPVADMFSLGISVMELLTGMNLPCYHRVNGRWQQLVRPTPLKKFSFSKTTLKKCSHNIDKY
jgi:hypothetical protein